MKPTEPTRRKLEDLSRVFAPDNEKREIQWSNDLRFFGVAVDDETILITPTHAEMLDLDLPRRTEFNLLINTTSHEVEHTIVDTAIIEEFVEEYDDLENMASTVMNTLEDVYIDRRRTNRKRGLRPIQAQFAELYVESKDPIPEQDFPHNFISAFRQVALAGYAKGIEDADDDVQEFAARTRPLVREARETHTTQGRKEIGHQVMDILKEYVDASDIPDDMEMPYAPIGISVEEAEGDEERDVGGDADAGDNDQDGDQEDGQAGGQQDEKGDEEGDGSSGGDDGDEESDETGSGGEQGDDDAGDQSGDSGIDGDDGDQQQQGTPTDGDSGGDETGQSTDVEAELEDMSNQDAGDWHDVPEGQDYTEIPDFVDQSYDNVRSKEKERDTDLGRRKAERDDRMENERRRIDSGTVEEEYDNAFAEEVAEAFRQIKTRDRPTPATHGQRINMRGYIRFRSGDTTEERLYLEDKPSEAGDRCITVAVDGSGSMDEMDTKLALRALAHATDLIGDRFAAVEYHKDGSEVRTDIITAPDENFEPAHLDSFATHGYTPTAHGIKDARGVADAAPNSEDVLIIITDGAANVDLNNRDRDGSAMEDAAAQVNSARAEGKRVIGVGIGGGVTPDYMESIFGENYVMVDMDNLASRLLDIYRDQMETA